MREQGVDWVPVPVDSVGGPMAGSEDSRRGSSTGVKFSAKTFGLVTSQRLKDRHVGGGVFGGKCPILRLSGGEDRVGVWDVWVRPPRRAASQPGSRDRWGGAAAQWPQFERSPIQIGGGGDTGEENSGGGGSEEKSAADFHQF